MEVILKKTKITSSILKQTLRSTEEDFKSGEILGWCLYNRLKFIVCYRPGTKGLSIYPMFNDIECSEPTDTKHWVKVKIGNGHTPIMYSCEDSHDEQHIKTLLVNIKSHAEKQGQFFI